MGSVFCFFFSLSCFCVLCRRVDAHVMVSGIKYRIGMLLRHACGAFLCDSAKNGDDDSDGYDGMASTDDGVWLFMMDRNHNRTHGGETANGSTNRIGIERQTNIWWQQKIQVNRVCARWNISRLDSSYVLFTSLPTRFGIYSDGQRSGVDKHLAFAIFYLLSSRHNSL